MDNGWNGVKNLGNHQWKQLKGSLKCKYQFLSTRPWYREGFFVVFACKLKSMIWYILDSVLMDAYVIVRYLGVSANKVSKTNLAKFQKMMNHKPRKIKRCTLYITYIIFKYKLWLCFKREPFLGTCKIQPKMQKFPVTEELLF